MGIVIDLQLERTRRQLALYLEVPLSKIKRVKGKRAFRVLLADVYPFDNITVMILDNDEMIQVEGLLTDKEIDEVLEELKGDPDMEAALDELANSIGEEQLAAFKKELEGTAMVLSNTPDGSSEQEPLDFTYNPPEFLKNECLESLDGFMSEIKSNWLKAKLRGADKNGNSETEEGKKS